MDTHLLRLMLSISFLISLFGCTTTKAYERRLASWIGLSEKQLVDSWGPPTSVYSTGDGEKMLTYMDSSGAYMTSYGVAYSIWCRTTMTVDGSGKVVNWRWEGNNCRARE